jgi:putative DNA primase/helicase
VSQELVELQGDHLNAQRFLDAHGAQVRWAPELGRYYVWSGSWWEEDRTERVQDLALETIDGLRAWVTEASGDEFRRRSAHYAQSSRAGRVEAMLQVARPRLVVGVEELDQHPYLLACLNGEVDLRTGELHSSDSAHLLTRGITLEYDPGADSSVWAQFLGTTFDGDEELTAYVQRALGYASTGAIREHVALVPWGTGANGKSTLLGTVQDILGELALTAPEGLFTETLSSHPHPERMAALRGRRLVTCYELENRATLAEGLIKTLTGGDRLSARELYGRRFDFAPTHKMVIVTNHKPRVRGTDESIWRRLRLVPFEHTVQPQDQDGSLRQRLVTEHGQAILAWVVEGAVAWFADGLGESKKVTTATADYRAEQDTFSAFLDECTEESPRARTPVGELWATWRTWCEATGERPGRMQSFSAALEEHGTLLESYQGKRYARNLISRRGPLGFSDELPHERDIEKLYAQPPQAHTSGPKTWPDGTPHRLLEGTESDHEN